MTSRRELLRMGLLAGPAIMLDRTAKAEDRATVARAESPLKILILGGTGFIGPHMVNHAMARGHEITLFNRGRTNAQLFPELEKIQGDRREGELSELQAAVDGGRTWDVVIDTSCYYPRVVNQAMDVLDKAIGQYIVISSISVYEGLTKAGLDETAPLGTIEDETTEEVTGESYGPLKVLCEQAAETRLPGRVTVLRPGLIVGPRDSTDRFTYWPLRVRRGGEVMAPGNHDDPVSFIDARDLGAFTIRCCEERIFGIFNTNGPKVRSSIAELIYACKAVDGQDATFTWVDADFLAEHEVAPWMQMTVWIPPRDGYEGFHLGSIEKAKKAGLTFRPLAEIIA
ncbi:MAG: NAD-dependent epimerase/dehydratase family protein, partial [Phycisphaerales bacterium]|nr:NAD-dependent epimerase/dehydratase family protein [Phycisphaerales bacterium]